MKRVARILMVAMATVLGVFALGPAGTVGAYPPGQSSGITTNVPSVVTDDTFTATVNNCLPGEMVTFTFEGATASAVCDPTTLQSGVPFAAPSTPGTYQVCATLTGTGADIPAGVTRPRTICTTIQVTAVTTPPVTTPGGQLSNTGSSGLGTTTTGGIVLLAAGVLLLAVSQVRRRRSPTAA
jgi:hypothetical protein